MPKISFGLVRSKNSLVGEIEDISSVDQIDLSDCGVEEVDNLELFHHIRQLNLAKNAIKVVENLELFLNLEHLDVSYNGIDGDGLLRSVAGIPRTLQSINISGNPCATDQNALTAFQDKFENLGIILEVEDVIEEDEEGTPSPDAEQAPSSSTPPRRGPLNTEDVLKEIVDRKCKLQDISSSFDLQATLQQLNKELDDTVSSSISHRNEKHSRSQGIVLEQDQTHSRHADVLRSQLADMATRGRSDKTALDDVMIRMRSRAEQALQGLTPSVAPSPLA